MRIIRLYGPLAKFLGRQTFEAQVASAAEAVRFLVTNFPQLEAFMANKHYRVSVGNYDLGEDELHHPAGQQEIAIVPVFTGAGGAFGKILLGVALITLSFFIPGSWAIAGIALKGLAFTIGASLALNGVSQLLMPVPSMKTGEDKSADPKLSYSFSGVQNVSRQGVPVPICYGQVLVGSIVASAGIDVVQT
jgi:predicted phage tail protein